MALSLGRLWVSTCIFIKDYTLILFFLVKDRGEGIFMYLLVRFTIEVILDFLNLFFTSIWPFFKNFFVWSSFKFFLFDLFLSVKLPQIMKIVNAGSGQGISLIAVMCELFAISATTTYGYAMSFPFRCD